jgi:hypothetical protein
MSATRRSTTTVSAKIAAWRRRLDQRWAALRIGEVKIDTGGGPGREE